MVADPKNAEAWKIAGYAEFYLKRYPEAARPAVDPARRKQVEQLGWRVSSRRPQATTQPTTAEGC